MADDGMSSYYGELRRANLAPLWESLAGMVPEEPRPKAMPHRWSYAETRALLLEAGQRITAEQAERRVAILVNPGIPGSLGVTDTLYAGLQLILPGEVAPAHRHSQSALRFVFEGKGAWTSVDDQRIEMRPGDFIVTPPWRGHDHGGGSEPVIWMDGLDVPLVGFLNAQFREDRPQVAEKFAEGRVAWPFEEARAALEALRSAGEPDPWTGYRSDYLQPDGRPALPTLSASLTLLPAGFTSQGYRSTDSAVATVVEGLVRAKVGGRFFELRPRDVLAIPGWTSVSFKALEESLVFAFSDRPAHQALGLWREQRDEA